MKQVFLKVFNMSCIGCTNTVKMTLEKFPGIEKVTVELIPPEATILCEDNIIPHDIIKYLEEQTSYTSLVNIDKKP